MKQEFEFDGEIGGGSVGSPAVIVREYRESDFDALVRVYQSAFAEAPWNEFKRCVNCSQGYGLTDYTLPKCVSCTQPLVTEDFWEKETIKSDLVDAVREANSFVLVAQADTSLVGFTWGYKLPAEKFPFLGDYARESIYMDEIAVAGSCRLRGVGRSLGDAFLDQVAQQGFKTAVLRTDERNVASMALFAKLGFQPLRSEQGTILYDPNYANRIYLAADRCGTVLNRRD